jgi:hypothetical protein
MFETTNHDFGTVARGAKAQFEFALTNGYVEDVHIAGAHASCGCTIVTFEKPLLKTHEKGAIVATLNTNAFLGQRGATITVTFDQPFPAEARLTVRGYIRNDVIFSPGSVNFGSVDQASPAEQKVLMYHTGWADWRVLNVESSNPSITARATETGRQDGQVWYDVYVQLSKDAPAGYLKDHVTLVTNDQQNGQIPLLVEGHVVPAGISVTPSPLLLGVVQPGQQVTRPVVLKGNKPFRILSISCDDASFKFLKVDQSAKPIHVVPVTFVAGKEEGKVRKSIRIQTDAGSPEISAYAEVGSGTER